MNDEVKNSKLGQAIAFAFLIIGCTFGVTQYFHSQHLELTKQEFEIDNKKSSEKINALEREIEKYKQKTTQTANKSNWSGKWDTWYDSGLHHEIIFSESENNLIGKYHFNKTTGEIIITKNNGSVIEGTWVQKNEHGMIETGILTFILDHSNIKFNGFYNKSNNRKTMTWNGVKI